MARKERGALLRRAVESVLSQRGVSGVPLLVVNGPLADAELVRDLSADARLRVTVRPEADLPAALRAGRDLVDSPYFGELDDDDVLLPGALAARVLALQRWPHLDAIVTNGFVQGPSGAVVHIRNVERVRRDPLRAILERNWLLPGSWLCRTTKVDSTLFEGMPKYLECTFTGLRLAGAYRMGFLGRPTVIWHTNSVHAPGERRDRVLGEVAALERLVELPLPEDIRSEFRRRIACASHAAAHLLLSEGDVAAAWLWHTRSLCEPGGWRYLPFTRWLLRGQVPVSKKPAAG